MKSPVTGPRGSEGTFYSADTLEPPSPCRYSFYNYRESQVLEAIQCPACSARYGLRREIVKASHKRARCCRCFGEFPIGDQVAALLGLPAREAEPHPTSTMGFMVGDLGSTAPGRETLAPDDLLMSSEDILDKTLVTSAPEHPEVRDAVLEPPPEERTSPGRDEGSGRSTGSYRSAKDAISQLFGDAPVVQHHPPRLGRPSADHSNTQELEATLSALEQTLGGTPIPPAPAAREPEAPASEALHQEDLADSSGATQRMSLAELQAAMAAIPAAAPVPEPTPEPAPEVPDLRAAEVTQMMDATRATRPQPNPATTHPLGPILEPSGDDPNLLRLRIGEEIYPNLTMDQLTRWVEEGRVIETHQVARQFSENWIEAHKVPGLRPVFERLKRLREGAPSFTQEPTAPVKKSLFGGLFGKKDH